MAKTIISAARELIPQDINKWLYNQRVFVAPVALIYLMYVASQIQVDGLALTDFVPSNGVAGAMVLFIINAFIDLFRKWSGEHTYKE